MSVREGGSFCCIVGRKGTETTKSSRRVLGKFEGALREHQSSIARKQTPFFPHRRFSPPNSPVLRQNAKGPASNNLNPRMTEARRPHYEAAQTSREPDKRGSNTEGVDYSVGMVKYVIV